MKNFKVCQIEDLQKTGIYKITCIDTNKIYVGSAMSTSKSKKGFMRRWQDHIYKLRSNKHRNKYLQESWNNFSEDSFIFEIIEFCNKNSSKEKEEFWIKKLKSSIKENGFNMIIKGLNNYKFSNEHKQKISQALKGRTRPKEIVQKWSNKVKQFTRNGELLNEYYSISEASRQTKINRQDIGQAIIGRKLKTAGGFIWKKVDDIV